MGDEYFANMESLTGGGDLGLDFSSSATSSATMGDFQTGGVSLGKYSIVRVLSDDNYQRADGAGAAVSTGSNRALAIVAIGAVAIGGYLMIKRK